MSRGHCWLPEENRHPHGQRESWTVAYHEIGHALVAAKQNNFCARCQKITIIPRTSGALGYTMQVEEGNTILMTKEEIEDKIATLTGGRAARKLRFGSVTPGAFQRYRTGTQPCPRHDHPYGMSERLRHGGA